MFCKYCGKEIADDAVACTGCGRPTDMYFRLTGRKPPQSGAPVKPAADNARAEAESGQKTISSLGVAGFAIGLAALFMGAFLDILPVVGLVLSSIAMKTRKNYPYKGLTVAGLILNICAFVLWLAFYAAVIAAAFSNHSPIMLYFK